MAAYFGSARVDERGKYSGGAPGDQTGKEVSTQPYYLHAKGWVVIRAKDPKARLKIAEAMRAACANNNIGYSQSDRYGLYNATKTKGFNPANCNVKVNTDCSGLIRVCCCYAGIMVGDFNTAAEVNVLKSTGKFDIITDTKITNNQNMLLEGDILVTRTKGHTVAVTESTNKSNTATTSTTSTNNSEVAMYTIKKNSKGNEVKKLQNNLNKVLGVNLTVDGVCGNNTVDAIKKFQKKNGLEVDGVYGKKSYETMSNKIK